LIRQATGRLDRKGLATLRTHPLSTVRHAQPRWLAKAVMIAVKNVWPTTVVEAARMARSGVRVCEKPVCVAIERIDQCVASFGVERSVRSITAAT
jgi:hypothetical protein